MYSEDSKVTPEEFRKHLKDLLLKMKRLTAEYDALKKELKNMYH